MDETVSASNVGRNFFRILRRVKAGRTYVVTSCGAPVARIVPAARHRAFAAAAKAMLMGRLRSQPVQIIGHRWNRDELYED